MKSIFKIVLIILSFSPVMHAWADDNNYSYNKIPPELLKNANAVVRNYHMHIRIVSLDEIYITTQYAVTVLNEDGKKYAKLSKSYDHFTKIDKIKGTLYDKDGNEVRKIRPGDIMDIAPYSYFVEDNRFKLYESGYSVYPYTYEFEIEERYKFSFYLPEWRPQFDFDCAVENADIEVDYPKDVPLRYDALHLPVKPAITSNEDGNVLTASVSNIKATGKDDKFSANNSCSLPTLLLASDKFELEDEDGDMKSWKDLGSFVYKLNENRDVLPEATKKIVHQLTDTCKSPYSKIRILYKYLGETTRYYLIALGIGGWQTLDATFVSDKGYGDCKALSNYMKALLKEAGITSYQALVFAGRENDHPIQTDFPNPAFDHVILCVPMQNDSVWLECTDAKDLPAGYLADFTDDRQVLLLTPDGGALVKTPVYSASENVFARNTALHIDDNDEVEGSASLKYEGIYSEREKAIIDEGKTKMMNHLNELFFLPTCNVKYYKDTLTVDGRIPVVNEQVAVTGSANITRSGKRVFIQPTIIPFKIKAPNSFDDRKTPFRLKTNYTISDTGTIKIDGAYSAEYLPADVDVSYSFARYSCRFVFDGNNQLKIIKTYSQKEGIYDGKQFADYIKLSKLVNNTTSEDKIVLVKKG